MNELDTIDQDRIDHLKNLYGNALDIKMSWLKSELDETTWELYEDALGLFESAVSRVAMLEGVNALTLSRYIRALVKEDDKSAYAARVYYPLIDMPEEIEFEDAPFASLFEDDDDE